MSLIECKSVTKVYGGGDVRTEALKGVSFSIEKGEFVSIMGPSGSGKSTLMHILGLLDPPTSGQYLFYGHDIATYTEDDLATLRNQNIGFVFQSFNLLPRTSVFENVELPLLYSSLEDKTSSTATQKKQAGIIQSIRNTYRQMRHFSHKKQVLHALESVGLSGRAQYLSNQLSGGEKQRVAIARALVNNPDIIFADEPTGNLDSKSGLQVMRILQDLNQQGHTVILVTHEVYTAQHAKRILRIKDGELVSDETVAQWRDARDERGLLK